MRQKPDHSACDCDHIETRIGLRPGYCRASCFFFALPIAGNDLSLQQFLSVPLCGHAAICILGAFVSFYYASLEAFGRRLVEIIGLKIKTNLKLRHYANFPSNLLVRQTMSHQQRDFAFARAQHFFDLRRACLDIRKRSGYAVPPAPRGPGF